MLITCSSIVLFIYTLWQWKFSTAGTIYHNILPWVNQYRKSVGFTFSTIQVPGYPIVLVSQSTYRAIWNWSNNCWWGYYRQIIFRVFLLVTEHDTTFSRYSWCQIFIDPTKKYHIMSVFPVLCYFIK